ncbi:MAG: hypothetical protein PHG85_05600 [Candidatus Altiarchaeota archaeon]|nr:hypothetical protein [Candidatus Altiarchaeota archaeon]
MAGASPSFGEVHIVRTLLALYSGRLGRKALVRLLGIGEGSVRTILNRLEAEGRVVSKARGHALSAKGRRIVEGYLGRFTMPVEAHLDVAPGLRCSVVVLRDAAGLVGSGLREREIAVRAGSDGAVLLKYGGGGLFFPCGDMPVENYPATTAFLKDKAREGDVVVIGFSESYQRAAEGALAIALNVAKVCA